VLTVEKDARLGELRDFRSQDDARASRQALTSRVISSGERASACSICMRPSATLLADTL